MEGRKEGGRKGEMEKVKENEGKRGGWQGKEGQAGHAGSELRSDLTRSPDHPGC